MLLSFTSHTTKEEVRVQDVQRGFYKKSHFN